MEGVAWEEDRSWLRALAQVQRDGHGAGRCGCTRSCHGCRAGTGTGDSWWHRAHSRAAPEEISLQALPDYHPPA